MEEWKECKLGEIATITKLAGFEFTKYIKYNETGEIIALRALNLRNGRLDLTEVKHIDKSVSDSLPRSKLYKGEILFTYTGNGYGDCALVDEDDKYHLAPNICKISPNKKIVDSNFLFQTIRSNAFYKQVSNYIGGSSQPTIPMETIRQLKVKLPPLPTQQKIAAILSSLDDKIELNNKINTNLEQQAQAIFKNWFVDFEPFGGKMPEGWKEVEFRDVCENITDGVHNTVVDDPNGEYLLLSCKNIKGGVLTISSSERKINKETFEKLRKRTKLAKGDILLSSVGTVGEMYLLNETPDNYEFQRSVAIIKPNTSLISPAFLYESMLSQKDTIIHSAHGAVQQCIFISDVGDFTTILPTLDVIEKFTNIVQPMLDTITANQHVNSKLANIRDTLLPKLMNGEIEV